MLERLLFAGNRFLLFLFARFLFEKNLALYKTTNMVVRPILLCAVLTID
jgi:hypothetical protein